MVKLDRICREANVMLVFARSYGLTGLVRISVKVKIMVSNPTLFYKKTIYYYSLVLTCWKLSWIVC